MHAFPEAPSFIPFRRRAGIVAVAVALNSALYLAINNRQPVDAHVVTASALDAALGLHAWTIWPYWLLLLLAPAMALAIRGRYLFAATMRAYVVALVLNVVLWLAVPTRLPRMPLPDGLDAATARAWRLLLAVDAPGNCFPSGHVTLPLVIAAGFSLQYPRFAPATWLAIVALLPSVVTTGQHVAMDIAGGAATALIGLVVTRHPFLWRARRDVAATTNAVRASHLPRR
ncbi:phosphatase PAP2 family protein [Lysobacter sp. HA35]